MALTLIFGLKNGNGWVKGQVREKNGCVVRTELLPHPQITDTRIFSPHHSFLSHWLAFYRRRAYGRLRQWCVRMLAPTEPSS